MELYELARRAFLGTSFSPERRAKDTVQWIEEQLEADLENIKFEGSSTGNYDQKYMEHARKWLSAKSRVMSSMITGPANFPVARNQKYLSYEDSAYAAWMKWRERYIKAVLRKPTPSPEADLDEALKDYDKAIQNQELMKSANKIVRKKGTSAEEKIIELTAAGFSYNICKTLIEPDRYGDYGFPSYALTNNNSKIKRLKEKVLTMKARISRKETFEPILFEGGSIEIENDRVVIRHNEKPDREVIDRIKARGFRWSRNYSCWSRKHTAQAIYDAKEIVIYES